MLENYAELLLFIAYKAAYGRVEGYRTQWGHWIPARSDIGTVSMAGTTPDDRFQHIHEAMSEESPRAYEMAKKCVRNWLISEAV